MVCAVSEDFSPFPNLEDSKAPQSHQYEEEIFNYQSMQGRTQIYYCMKKLLPRHIFVESLDIFQNMKHWDGILYKLYMTKNCDSILKSITVLIHADCAG